MARDRPSRPSSALTWRVSPTRFAHAQATLRLKMDHKNENFNMFDLVAYRIKFMEHPHAGDK